MYESGLQEFRRNQGARRESQLGDDRGDTRAGPRASLPRRGGSCPRRIRSVRELRRAHRCRAAGGATDRDSLRPLSGGVGAGQPVLIQSVSGLKALRERRYLALAQLVDDEARVAISKPMGNPPRVVLSKIGT